MNTQELIQNKVPSPFAILPKTPGQISHRNALLLVPFSIVVRISIDVIKYQSQKQLGQKRIYFTLQFHTIVCHGGKPGKELKAGTQRWELIHKP